MSGRTSTHLGIVFAGEVCNVLDKALLQIGLEAGDQAPVKDAKPAIRCPLQVARVRVAVQNRPCACVLRSAEQTVGHRDSIEVYVYRFRVP